jgi:biotin carboxylase
MRLPKAVYIIGGGPLGTKIIQWAKETGLVTIVTDMNSDAPGFALADVVRQIDGTDVANQLALVAEASREFQIAGVYCGAEFGLRTVYHLSEALGLETNSRQSIEAVLNKSEMKEIWKKDGISSPASYEVTDFDELRGIVDQGNERFILKPARGSGCAGVQLVESLSDLSSAFALSKETTPGNERLLLESFIEGRSIDANGIFLDDKFYGCGVLERFSIPFPHFLHFGGYDAADIPEKEVLQVYSLLEDSCRSLGLTFGPVKGDLIRTTSGYKILEVAPRFHGDVTTCGTLPYGSNINPVKFYFHYLKSGAVDVSLIEPGRIRYAAWRVICLPPGEVLSSPSDSMSPSNGVTMIWHNRRCQKRIYPYTDTGKIPGYICAFGDDKEDAERHLEEYFDAAKYEVLPDANELDWYDRLGRRIESVGFSKRSCGYVDRSIVASRQRSLL